MALKFKINKEAFDKLSDVEKAHYKATGMDFTLDVDGVDDPTPELRRAHEREKQRAQGLETELTTVKQRNTELETLLGQDPAKRGDIQAIEASWKQKLTDAEKKGTAAVDKLRTNLRKTLVNNAASAMAKELSGDNAELMMPHILSRLDVDFEGDEPALRILDATGKPSAASLGDLSKELVANKSFAAIIVGSNGTGGGASGGKQGGGGATKPFAEMNSKERAELHKTDPERFKRESAAQNTVRI